MACKLDDIACIVLCGGRGTRLQSVIKDIPKPMAPLTSGIPFLHFLLGKLYKQGITHFHLATGYQSIVIEDYFKTHDTPFDVTIWKEHEPLGTGGAIRNIATKLKETHFLVVNGDTYFDFDLNRFIAAAITTQKEAVLALKRIEKGNRYGQVKLEGDTISSFAEKQPFENKLINTGVYLIRRTTFLSNSLEGPFSIEKDYFEKHISRACIAGIEQKGFFIDIGIPEDYRYAQTQLNHED